MFKRKMSKLVWNGKKHTPRRFLARNKRYIPELDMNAFATTENKTKEIEGKKTEQQKEDDYYEELGNFVEQNPIGGHLRGRGQNV